MTEEYLGYVFGSLFGFGMTYLSYSTYRDRDRNGATRFWAGMIEEWWDPIQLPLIFSAAVSGCLAVAFVVLLVLRLMGIEWWKH